MARLVPYLAVSNRTSAFSTLSTTAIGWNFSPRTYDNFEKGDVVIVEISTYASNAEDLPFTITQGNDGLPWTTSGLQHADPKYFQFFHCQITSSGELPASLINQTVSAYVVGSFIWKNVRFYEFYEYNLPRFQGYVSLNADILNGTPSNRMVQGDVVDFSYGNIGYYGSKEFYGPYNSEDNIWSMGGPVDESGSFVGNLGFYGLNVGTATTKNFTEVYDPSKDVNVDPFPEIPYFKVYNEGSSSYESPNAAHYGYAIYFRPKSKGGWKIGHI